MWSQPCSPNTRLNLEGGIGMGQEELSVPERGREQLAEEDVLPFVTNAKTFLIPVVLISDKTGKGNCYCVNCATVHSAFPDAPPHWKAYARGRHGWCERGSVPCQFISPKSLGCGGIVGLCPLLLLEDVTGSSKDTA